MTLMKWISLAGLSAGVLVVGSAVAQSPGLPDPATANKEVDAALRRWSIAWPLPPYVPGSARFEKIQTISGQLIVGGKFTAGTSGKAVELAYGGNYESDGDGIKLTSVCYVQKAPKVDTDCTNTVTGVNAKLLAYVAAARAEQFSEAGLTYVIGLGRGDERYVYPTRIAQQLPFSLDEWVAIIDFAQLTASNNGGKLPELSQLRAKAAALAAQARASTPKSDAYKMFTGTGSVVYALVNGAGRGDTQAQAYYHVMVESVAADPFMREVFEAATFKRSLIDQLRKVYESPESSRTLKWRIGAIGAILLSRDIDAARESLDREMARAEAPRRGNDRPSGATATSRQSSEERDEPRRCVAWRDIRGAPNVWTDQNGSVHTDEGGIIGTECSAWSR